MLCKIFWNVFEKTGSIEAYLYESCYHNLNLKRESNKIELTKAANDNE
ncbi:YqzL family protein [Alkaliphilus peptidifermentans]|uniref:YqzL-like protein n=1 Tax=Alkaliphilus peptidifermentans DSM 18978 TaxID=1120976 RepID=A0A1G5BU98_9FIRM|nr:YqzL family protein [Alkaliphilus peptidifermentans]SCX93656.1 hypothetical protein SAMN03080606_00523 [Alkaliphilus peptidifermentans DSM 18978]